MVEKPAQSRGGVKGGFPLAGSRGGAPLWGLGQRPNRSTGDQFKGRTQPRRRQRSVPASNFALPQERPQAAFSTYSTLSRQMGATDQQGKRFGFLLLVFFVAGVSPLRRRVEGFAVAPDTPSQRTSMLLDFLCCRGISRLRARVGGFAVAPDTPSQRTFMLLDFSCCKGELHLPPSLPGKKFPKGAFPPCAKRKSMLQYARIEAFERAEASVPVRENVFVDNPDEELRKEDFSYAVRLL